MPKGVVKTPADEKRWEEAKKRVRDEYDLTEDDDRFWRLVNGIYQKMSKAVSDEELDSHDITEGLSSLVHDQWIDFAKEVEGEVAPKRAEAWQSMYVPYFELPEVEKEKDRVFARRIVFLLQNPRVAKESLGADVKQCNNTGRSKKTRRSGRGIGKVDVHKSIRPGSFGQQRSVQDRQRFLHPRLCETAGGIAQSRSAEESKTYTRIGFRLSKGFSDAHTKPLTRARHTGQRASSQLLEWGSDTHTAGSEDVYTFYRRLMGAQARGEITVSTLKTDERGSILRVTDGKVTFRVYEPRNGPARLLKGLHTYTPTANAVWTILRSAGYDGKPVDGVGHFAGCTITVKGADVHVEGKKAHRILQLLEREQKHKITAEAWVGGHQQLGQPPMTAHPW